MAIPRDKYWRWTTLAPLLAVLAVFVVTMIDPFEWESVTKKWSARIVYKVYGAFYPKTIRDKITIVFLDRNTLDRRGETWPPTHLIHADVLSAILDYHPAAVLVDMFFTERRDGDYFQLTKNLIEKNAENSGQKVPIYVIGDFNGGKESPPARKEIMDLASTKALSLVSAEVKLDSEVTTVIPLERVRHGNLNALPASLAIASDECPSFADTQTCQGLRALSGSGLLEHEPEEPKPLEVVWGLEPEFCKHVEDSDLTEWGVELRRKCSEVFTNWYSRAAQLMLQDSMLPKSYRICDPVPIPYHVLLSSEQVLDGNMHERLKGYLTGKIVIYGARYRATSDRVLSPVHGQIDGAYAQAMAIDNLLTFGDRYMHPTSAEGVYLKNITDYQPTILLFLSAVVVGIGRRALLRPYRLDPKKELTEAERDQLLRDDERILWWSRFALYVVIVIVGAIEFIYLRISPLNWLGILLVVEAIHWFGRKKFLPRR